MLTTTIDSPQHKRVLRRRNIRKNEHASNNIRQTYKLDEDVIRIKKAKEIHLEIIKCARNVNDAYSLHILLSTLASLILIIIISYNMFRFLMSMDYRKQLLTTFNFLYWISHFAIKIVIVTYELLMLYLISLHATNTGDILCELYEPSISNEFCAEISDFTLQLIQNPLIFRINGFFDIDHTLIRNVIGIITTYIIILIQVGDLPQALIKNSTLSTNNN
ncbi:putative gustatory receptor 28b [Vespa velutina]|uniref:putative gustatory receptor 28b n=1 Tax=Vespa velutina TaxID=202808 RepID=UPI001FB40E58|nr:putative gustatory receptor 28b [Vespa velutina]